MFARLIMKFVPQILTMMVFGHLIFHVIGIDFYDFVFFSSGFVSIEQILYQTLKTVWPHFQTCWSSSKILRHTMTSYFQLCSQCLEMWLSLSCLIYMYYKKHWNLETRNEIKFAVIILDMFPLSNSSYPILIGHGHVIAGTIERLALPLQRKTLPLFWLSITL